MTFDSGKAAAVSSGRLAVVLSACIGCGTGLETVYVLLSDTRSADCSVTAVSFFGRSELKTERFPAVLIPSAVLRSASELLSARLHFLLTQRNRTVRLFPAVCPAAETFLHSAPFQHPGAQTVPGAVP